MKLWSPSSPPRITSDGRSRQIALSTSSMWSASRARVTSPTSLWNEDHSYISFQSFWSSPFMKPRFDEQYVDYGMNKLIWIFRLRVADYKFRVLHSLSMFLIQGESHLFQWWIGWHCPRTWTWYERRMVVLRKWTTTWGSSLWAWRREGIEDTSPVV